MELNPRPHKQLLATPTMDDDFFGETAAQPANHPHSANEYNNADEEFDFGDAQYEAPQQGLHTNSNPIIPHYSNAAYQSQPSFEVDEEATRRIKEEEQRIQEELRKKSENEYQLKQDRREKGRKQLQQFLEQKEEEKAARVKENYEKEQTRRQQVTANELTGWKKVAASVPLKQGEHPGRKEVNRMREAIINKRKDEA